MCSIRRAPAAKHCLSDRLAWEGADAAAGVLLARTVLHHSNEERFRPMLPFGVGLVRARCRAGGGLLRAGAARHRRARHGARASATATVLTAE